MALTAPKWYTGTSDATVPVAPGERVLGYSCVAGGSGATIVVTTAAGVVLPTITLPANAPFADTFNSDPRVLDRGDLPAGSTIAFAGIATYFVRVG